MRILDPKFDIERFMAEAPAARERALLLDYDGVLAPFRADRDSAFPYPRVREALRAIMNSETCKVSIVSGRAAEEVVPLLGLDPPPEIWGAHGRQRRRADGTSETFGLITEGQAEGLGCARAWAEGAGVAGRAESKPGCFALHWRGLPAAERAGLQRLGDRALGEIARACGLSVWPFDGGMELRAPDRDKGSAVRQILEELPRRACVAYLGDDLTDEAAFAAIRGRGLAALVRPSLRPTSAQVWLRPPAELLKFLGDWMAACRVARGRAARAATA